MLSFVGSSCSNIWAAMLNMLLKGWATAMHPSVKESQPQEMLRHHPSCQDFSWVSEGHVESSVPQQRPLPLHSRRKLELEGCAFNSNNKGCALNTLRRHITVTPHHTASHRGGDTKRNRNFTASSQRSAPHASRVVLVLRVLLLVSEDV